jgi:hypothetical protein
MRNEYPSGQLQVAKPGEFNVINWAGYPEGQFGLTRPTQALRLVSGEGNLGNLGTQYRFSATAASPAG